MRIAYLASRYPLVSHTFIEGEVRALRSLGVTVDTFSVRRPEASEVRSEQSFQEQRLTRVLVGDRAALLRAHLAALRHPGALIATFAAAVGRGRGARGRLRQFLYTGEAVVLWWHAGRGGVTHLHAHFANVGADVVRTAADLRRRTHPTVPWTWSFTMHGPTEFAAVEESGLAGKVADADLVICISDFCRSQLMALVGEREWAKLVVVHCGVDLEHFVPVERSPVEDRPVRVLCVGRLVGVKGQAVLIDAAARMLAGGTPVEVVFVGDGPRRTELEQEAAERGLADRAQFTGALGHDEIAGWYRWADVFCLPSFAEGVPVVLMEAMASGLPVVSTRIAGIPELIEDRCSGLLVPPGRADLLAAALTELAIDADLRSRLAEAGRRVVAESFDQGASALQLLDAFGHLDAFGADGEPPALDGRGPRDRAGTTSWS